MPGSECFDFIKKLSYLGVCNFWGCCTAENPCDINQGDCDSHPDCNGDLGCGEDNCPADFPSHADCCVDSSGTVHF